MGKSSPNEEIRVISCAGTVTEEGKFRRKKSKKKERRIEKTEGKAD